MHLAVVHDDLVLVALRQHFEGFQALDEIVGLIFFVFIQALVDRFNQFSSDTGGKSVGFISFLASIFGVLCGRFLFVLGVSQLRFGFVNDQGVSSEIFVCLLFFV